MDLKSTYNKIAKLWSDQHENDDWWVPGTNTLISFLKPGATILDVGCGSGMKVKYFTEKGFNVTGFDFSEEMIRIAKEENPQANLFMLDMYDIDSIQETFDCVFAQASLLHIQKNRVLEVLEKMKNRLNQKGLLYIAVKEMKADQEEEKVLTENDYGFEYERFFSFFTMPELEGYFKKLNVEVMWKDILKSGNTNWLQIIGKKI